MTATPAALRSPLATLSFQHVLLALVALTVIRIVGLYYSQVDLFYDEAQYWAWSRELAFGYFSKPPLLAWIIAASEPVCGSGEACVRAASPVFYFATCLVVYAIGNELYDRQTAAWSAVTFALAIGMSFSSRIISTDVPLVFFWAVALLAYIKLMPAPDWRWAIALGVSLGLGLLAKYAMVYFALCAACAACFERDARKFLVRPQTWIALAIAALFLLPNVYWNFANNFATFKHTGDNITGGGFRFQPLEAAAFVGSQFAVVGPLVFAAFLVILFRIKSPRINTQDRLMLAFAAPPLALITALSFVRGANANWAAVSALSLTVLVVAWWLRNGDRRWLTATIVIGLIAQAVLLVGDAYAYRVSVPALGRKADLYQRTLGWRGLGEQAARLARAAGARTVVAEGRAELAALIYYLRHEPLRALSWSYSPIPQHHFDMTRAFDNAAPEPILFIGHCPWPAPLERYFADVTPLGPLTVSSGASSVREYHAFQLVNRKRAIAPLGPCVKNATP